MTKFQTVLLAILAAAVAGLLYKFVPEAKEIAAGVAALAIWLLGYAKQHTQDAKAIAAAKGTATEADDEPTQPLGPKAAAVMLLAGSLLLAGPALAQAKAPQALGCIDAANTYCVVPAAAVGWQVNLKTGGAANAVSLVGLTLQHTFGSLPVGLGLYAGLGASSENRGSYQGCIGASITSWGLVCGGVQRIAGEGIWQGMVTFAPQLTFGGTPSYVREAR